MVPLAIAALIFRILMPVLGTLQGLEGLLLGGSPIAFLLTMDIPTAPRVVRPASKTWFISSSFVIFIIVFFFFKKIFFSIQNRPYFENFFSLPFFWRDGFFFYFLYFSIFEVKKTTHKNTNHTENRKKVCCFTFFEIFLSELSFLLFSFSCLS